MIDTTAGTDHDEAYKKVEKEGQRTRELLERHGKYERHAEMEAFASDGSDELLARQLAMKLRAEKALYNLDDGVNVGIVDELLDDGEIFIKEGINDAIDKKVADLTPKTRKGGTLEFNAAGLAELARFREQTRQKVAEEAFKSGHSEATRFYQALARKKILGEL